MPEYDAIVIGGGPGGSAAAYFLARSGARVCVLEKKRFPRAKTCGDGLTPRSLKVLDQMGLAGELQTYQQVKGLRVIGAGRTMEMGFPDLSNFPALGLVRPRKDLDHSIAKQAASVGADYLMGTQAVAPLWEDNRLVGVHWIQKEASAGGGVVEVDRGELRAPVTVLADGASSSFGRALGLKRNGGYPMGLAIRTYYQSHRHDDEMFESWLSLRKGDNLLPGYGWIFPVGDGTVNVGVGLLTTFGRWREVNLNHLQRDYVDMLPASYGINHETQTERYQSGRLPMGASLVKPYGPGYLVIGDAAGMVNPFNGEGIAYALETGKLAASLVSSALARGSTEELAEYRQALHDIYGAYYRFGRRFVKLIGYPRPFQALVQVGMRSQTIMEFVFQILANLAEDSGGKLADRAFRRLLKVAERDLPGLTDPDIPSPPIPSVPKQEAGAA